MGTVRVPITIRVNPGNGLIRSIVLARFNAAKADGTLERATREALSRTILQAYRRLVLSKLPELLTPEIIVKDADGKNVKLQLQQLRLGQKIQREYLKVLRERDQAVLADRRTAARKLDVQVRSLQRQIAKRLQRNPSSALSSGKYRTRLFEVLNSLTDPTNLNIYWKGNELHWQIGNTNLLKGIRVPSYREEVQKGSAYGDALMWKQLVYGAGVYSTDPTGKRKPRGWRFLGLRIRGIRGVNLKIEYDQEALGYKNEVRAAVIGAV